VSARRFEPPARAVAPRPHGTTADRNTCPRLRIRGSPIERVAEHREGDAGEESPEVRAVRDTRVAPEEEGDEVVEDDEDPASRAGTRKMSITNGKSATKTFTRFRGNRTK
jgi:hypothetical protein